MTFVGRDRELSLLDKNLSRVGSGDLPGRALLLRGRRRVGKSRLVDIFCEHAGLPHLIFQASRGESPSQERDQFATAIQQSSFDKRGLLAGVQLQSWHAAFSQLAAILPTDQPSIVVIDEFPWLLEQDPTAEGALQTVWDRELSRKPVFLILIGSDLAMMERLSEYGRPFYQRGAEMLLGPLSPRAVGEILQLTPADAFDAALITGGLPLICQEWRPGVSRQQFLAETLEDPTSPLLVSAERALAAEFPTSMQARQVLTVIGSGERTFSNIAAKAGRDDGLKAGSLNPTLNLLLKKRIVVKEYPLSAKSAPRERRYRVVDPYLRFWFTFLGPRGIAEVESGRGHLVAKTIKEGWTGWRGRAIEPLVREALTRLLPNDSFPEAQQLGSWWNRINNPEIDLVAADREPARRISFVGSIKWLEAKPFDQQDFADLANNATAVPGVDLATPLVAVSRSGVTASGLHATWGPEELIAAW